MALSLKGKISRVAVCVWLWGGSGEGKVSKAKLFIYFICLISFIYLVQLFFGLAFYSLSILCLVIFLGLDFFFFLYIVPSICFCRVPFQCYFCYSFSSFCSCRCLLFCFFLFSFNCSFFYFAFALLSFRILFYALIFVLFNVFLSFVFALFGSFFLCSSIGFSVFSFMALFFPSVFSSFPFSLLSHFGGFFLLACVRVLLVCLTLLNGLSLLLFVDICFLLLISFPARVCLSVIYSHIYRGCSLYVCLSLPAFVFVSVYVIYLSGLYCIHSSVYIHLLMFVYLCLSV